MFQLLSYIKYWFHQVDEHSLHSPFLFDFYQTLIKNRIYEPIDSVEQLRSALLKSKKTIDFKEFGAGSRIENSNKRQLSKIAKYSTTPLKFSLFLRAYIEKYNCKRILELGTSLGINTLYLSDNAQVEVTTIEAEPTMFQLASKHFEDFNRKNIKLMNDSVDEVINQNGLNEQVFDLVYMDANHRYEPTLKYFDYFSKRITKQGGIIIDDIHWSKGMNQAWGEIIERPEVTLSIDLFEAGLIFLNPELPKEQLILKF